MNVVIYFPYGKFISILYSCINDTFCWNSQINFEEFLLMNLIIIQNTFIVSELIQCREILKEQREKR